MENVEITDEMLKRWEIESGNERFFAPHIVSALCKALKSERAERAKNPGVWDGAIPISRTARVFYDRTEGHAIPSCSKEYTRELPKTKAREIAERKALIFTAGQKEMADIIEAAILEAQAQSN